MILVDTNVWSELLKTVRNNEVLAWLRANSEDLILSSIVLGELKYFVAKQDDGRRKHHMRATLDALVADRQNQMIGFDLPEATAYGKLMARMKRAGTPLPRVDGWIAAQAIVHNLIVATRNEQDFLPAGVKVVNPWSL